MTGWRKRQVMEMALEALETAEIDGNCEYGATEIIRKALAQPERSMKVEGPLHVICQCDKCKPQISFNAEVIGYVEPQRTWVELTEEDLKLLSAEWRIVYGAWMDDFARAIEAKLKEKNFD